MLNFYYDTYNLIVQRDKDGGDTAAREGAYWFEMALNCPQTINEYGMDEFTRVIKLLEPEPGVFIRNPYQNTVTPPAKSWNDPTDFSRDQTIPIILSLGQLKKLDSLKALLKHHITRFGFYANGDYPDPQTIGYYIRAFRAWYLYPVLFFTDLGLVVESGIRIVKGRNPKDTSDDINQTLALIQAQYNLPTPVSFLARKLYKIRGIQGAWDRYFNAESGANPFNELYRYLISKM